MSLNSEGRNRKADVDVRIVLLGYDAASQRSLPDISKEHGALVFKEF